MSLPALDDVARDYLLVALAAGRQLDGIVDAYYGPPEVRAQADARNASPASLADEAAALRLRVSSEVGDPHRRDWLSRQLAALETILRRLAGEDLDYVEEVERCFDARPSMTPGAVYDAAFATLDELLPGTGELRARVAARGDRLTVAAERLPAIIDWLVGEIRGETLRHFDVPAGESLSVSLVSDKPWSAYNWYDGNLRSRIEINTDLPIRAPQLIGLITHECFPGHHLEHAWKEQRLYRELGRGEASAQLINTPEAYISEGLAEVGESLILDRARWTELLGGICRRAGIELAADELDSQWSVSDALERLRSVSADASLLLHYEGRTETEVVAFIEQRSLRTPAQAAKAVEFINHPLWRTYVFCYTGGERLLRTWLDGAPEAGLRRDRFRRLLTEQLTPSAIRSEISANIDGQRVD